MKITTSLRTGFSKLLATGGLLYLAQTSAPAALVGQWVANDWSGGTNDWVDRVAGKIATVPAPANSPTQSAGLVFDGFDDYLEVAAAQNPIVGKTSVTIMAFFQTSQGASGSDESDENYPGPLNGELGPNGWGLTYDAAGYARGSFNFDIS
ncbi:MAG: hypothetical protein K9M97_07650, partial [Akkermansiaceae bacterium]|nr:hypothetical protein [Akkermansiaceae bacterium]